MDLFEQKGGLGPKLDPHPTTNIPAEFSWEQMSPGILSGVKRRTYQGQRIWWLLGGVGLAIVLFTVYLFWEPSPVPLGSFPLTLENASPTMASLDRNQNQSVRPPGRRPVKEESATQMVAAKSVNYQKIKEGQVHQKFDPSKASERRSTVDIQKSNDQNFIQEKSQPLNKDSILLPWKDMEVLSALPGSLRQVKYANGEPEFLPTPAKQDYARWTLELGIGANYFHAGYRSRQAEIGTPSSFETPLVGWQFTARIKRMVHRNWLFAGGIAVEKLRYRSNYFQEETINLYRPNTIDTIFHSTYTGETTYTYRDSVPGVRTRIFQHYNQHTLYRLPLLIGYQTNGHNWGISLHMGINFQLMRQSKGRTLYQPVELISLEEGGIYPSSPGIQVSTLGEVQVSFKVDPRLALFSRFSWEQQLSNWIDPELSFSQQPRIYAGQFGLAWTFR